MSQSAVLESPFNRLIDPLLPPLSASALDVYQIVTAIKKKQRLHFKIPLRHTWYKGEDKVNVQRIETCPIYLYIHFKDILNDFLMYKPIKKCLYTICLTTRCI